MVRWANKKFPDGFLALDVIAKPFPEDCMVVRDPATTTRTGRVIRQVEGLTWARKELV
jgi:hypothetical protein